MFNIYKRLARTLMAIAAGTMPLATTVDCGFDRHGGILYIDRFDDDHDFGFFDLVIDGFYDPYYAEEIIIFDDCCY